MISLKSIKYSKLASHETHCYQASLCWRGVKIGTVSNDGQGGCDLLHIHDLKRLFEAREYIGTLPERVSTINGEEFRFCADLESVCAGLVNDHLAEKELKRLLKNRVVLVRHDGVYQSRVIKNPAILGATIKMHSEGEPSTTVILNTIDFETALMLYKGAQS